MNGYLLDANIFINANRYYKREFFPIVWNFFRNTPEVLMLDRVYREIVALDDELSEWAKVYYKNNSISADQFIVEYQQVSEYLVGSQKWEPAGYEQWTNDYEKADPWLIACAKHNNYCIVTDENKKGPNGNKTANEPKIPFVAEQLSVSTINFWTFLRKEQFSAR